MRAFVTLDGIESEQASVNFGVPMRIIAFVLDPWGEFNVINRV